MSVANAVEEVVSKNFDPNLTGHCGLILRSFLCSKLKLMKVVFAMHLPRQSAYSCTVLISSHDRESGMLQLHLKCTIRQRFAP
jgi:hypothetical protein